MRRRGQEGFSLIEVVIALGILAGVLIAIGGLFILGGRSVKAGRTSSEALATAKEIVEEMDAWGFTQLWSNFGYNGQAATYTVDTRSNAACTAWQTALTGKLGPTAYATIKIDSVAQTGQSTPNFADSSGNTLARNVRVTVTAVWAEATGRNRQVSVITSRN